MSWIRTAAARLHQVRGQTLITFTLFLTALILFVGLVIDVGFAYLTRASLSKAVDAACLTGARNLSSGQGPAATLATKAFSANYPQSGRDVARPVPHVNFTQTADSNTLINVSANVAINTFFIRILPQWKTLTVSASGQAVRTKVVMMLVLDRSGSMLPGVLCGDDRGNCGSVYLPGAVSSFIDLFDEQTDRVGVSSFGYNATLDLPITQPFKTEINNTVQNWPAKVGGTTFIEGGLTKAKSAFQGVPLAEGENVARVVVFFTDGYANTFQDNFTCAEGQLPQLLNLGTSHERPGDGKTSGYLTEPAAANLAVSCFSLDLDGGPPPFSCCPMVTNFVSVVGGLRNVNVINVWDEARMRALETARQMRTDSDMRTTIYAIGLGDGIDRGFLQEIANDPASPNYKSDQPQGAAIFAPSAADLQSVFQTIASRILLRLTQ